MPETPRTWTLIVCPECGLQAPLGYECSGGGDPEHSLNVPVVEKEVIEKAPVDAERERMLDLLERVDDWLQVPDYTRYDDLVNAQQVEADVKALLREHGRLQGDEDD